MIRVRVRHPRRWWPVLGLLLALPASGHEVRPGFLEITEIEVGRFEVAWKQPVIGPQRLPIDVVLPPDCETLSSALPEHTGSALIERWRIGCSLRGGTLRVDGLSATLIDVLVRIRYSDGQVVSGMLRASAPTLDLDDPAPGAGAYFMLGVEHLLLGIDHILFVACLVLFIRAPWPLLQAVTAFTAAHSVTLALSVLGLVRLPQGPVEAVIALSILFLARELMVAESVRSPLTRAAPWLMAFAFGLLHGFGFAGALADIGLPRDQLALSLFLFNVGIEIGQLGVIGVMIGAAWLLGRPAHRRAGFRLEQAFCIATGCLAGFWTIDRVLALW